MIEHEFIPLADMAFDVEEEELDRATAQVIDDETLKLLHRENRVALAREPGRRLTVPGLPDDRSGFEVPLLFVVHAHPECSFEWARLLVDLTPSPGSVVADMAPREIEDLALDVETTVGVGLSFTLAASAVDIGAQPEIGRKRTVFFPTVLTSGVGFQKAYWDFYGKAGDYLHTDKELRMLIEAPADAPVMANLTVRAKVRFRGLPKLIPLLARTAKLDTTIRLA